MSSTACKPPRRSDYLQLLSLSDHVFIESRWAKTPGISRHSLYKKTKPVERGEKEKKKRGEKKRLISEKEEIVGNL